MNDADSHAWLIFFEDADRDVEVFVGMYAEQAARTRYEQASQSWNCTLFRSVSPPIDRHTRLPEHLAPVTNAEWDHKDDPIA